MMRISSCIWIITSRLCWRNIEITSSRGCVPRRSQYPLVLSSILSKSRLSQTGTNRSITDRLWPNFSLLQRGSGWISPPQYHSWLASVLRQVLHNGQPSITSWNTWKATRASRQHIDEATGKRICCRDTQIRIGAIAHLADRRPAWSCCTTRRRYPGSLRCRRLRLSPLRRPSTTQHQRLPRRSCTFDSS